MALAVALAQAGRRERAGLTVGHVVHDLRPVDETLADRDAVRSLAGELGLPFVEAAVVVRAAGGNLEGGARRERYRALVELAARVGAGHVATAHHAEDQLETMLMAMVRGAGPRGLAGMPQRRALASGVVLIRPMLRAAGIDKAACKGICDAAGVAWREDASNADMSRLRSAIRHRILPELLNVRPAAAKRAGEAAGLLMDAQGLVERRALRIIRDGADRARLAKESDAVVGEVVRQLCRKASGALGADGWGRRALEPVLRAIRDGREDVRTFTLRGVVVRVDGHTVTASRKGMT